MSRMGNKAKEKSISSTDKAVMHDFEEMQYKKKLGEDLSVRIERLKKWMTLDHAVMVILFLIVFVLVRRLSLMTPLLSDDYNYVFKMDGGKIDSIFDIYSNICEHYQKVNGRSVAHFIGQYLLFKGRGLYTLTTPLVFVLYVYLIQGLFTYSPDKLSAGDDSVINGGLYKGVCTMLAFFLVWHFSPVFGQDYLWVIGSANYLYTSAMLLFCAYYMKRRLLVDDVSQPTRAGAIVFMIFCFFSGWTNENTVPGVLLYLSYVFFLALKRKRDIGLWFFGVVSAMIIGYFKMILAPGNFIRQNAFYESIYRDVRMSMRLERMMNYFNVYFKTMLIAGIILAIIALVINRKRSVEPIILLICGTFSFYVTIMAPTFPLRAMIPTVYFYVGSYICSLSLIVDRLDERGIYVTLAPFFVFLMIYIQTYTSVYGETSRVYNGYMERDSIIKMHKRLHDTERVVVPGVSTDNRWVAAYGPGDVKTDPRNYVNYAVARYYGIKEIVREK